MLPLEIPSTGEGVTVWASLTFAWMALHYGVATDAMNSPAWGDDSRGGGTGVWSWIHDHLVHRFSWWATGLRGAIMFIITVAVCGTSARDLVVAGVAALLAMCLIGLRATAVDGLVAAAGEVALNAVGVLGIGVLLSKSDERFWHVLITFQVSDSKIAAVLFVSAGVLFMGKGGTYIVRGLLRAAGAMPKYRRESGEKRYRVGSHLRYEPEKDVWVGEAVLEKSSANSVGVSAREPDTSEFRRGRLIGNLERLVILVLAMLGSYPAIGFVMTAKGFVRAKEFEDRDYAEYFLVGTLGSSLVAILAGMLLATVIHELWR